LTKDRREYERLLARDDQESVSSIEAVSRSITLKERTYGTLLEHYETLRVQESLRANLVSIVEPATLPWAPSNPRYAINTIVGSIMGLILGIILAFIVENLDTTLYSTEQIEALTEKTAIARIPNSAGQLKILRLDGNGYQPAVEAFRRLRTNLLINSKKQPSNVWMVTSSDRGEGKSTIAANLAVTTAQSGRTVVLVDCDMRLPTLHKIFDQPNKRGLTDSLVQNLTLADIKQETAFQRLSLITAGIQPPNPTELLGSEQMIDFIEQLKSEYEIVLLDTPALLPVPDADVLMPLVDTVILIVARMQSKRDSVVNAWNQLATVKAKTVSLVVNHAESNGSKVY